jgi:hypothetical protein
MSMWGSVIWLVNLKQMNIHLILPAGHLNCPQAAGTFYLLHFIFYPVHLSPIAPIAYCTYRLLHPSPIVHLSHIAHIAYCTFHLLHLSPIAPAAYCAHHDFIKNMITGTSQADCGVLIIASPTPSPRRQAADRLVHGYHTQGVLGLACDDVPL